MNNELYHHGVKGMKWGVRRSPEQLSHKPQAQNGTDTSTYRSKKKKQFFQKIKNGIKNLRIDDPDVVALSAYGFYMHTAANTKDPLVRAYYTTLAIDQLNEYLED